MSVCEKEYTTEQLTDKKGHIFSHPDDVEWSNSLITENEKLKKELELWRREGGDADRSFEEMILEEYGDQSEQAKRYGFGVFK